MAAQGQGQEVMAQNEGHPSVRTSQHPLEAGEQQTSAEQGAEGSLAAVVTVHDRVFRPVSAPVVGEARVLFSGPEVPEVPEGPRWSLKPTDGLRRGAEGGAALSR